MVRRGRDEAHAGRGVAHLGDPRPDLGAGQVPALAGLGALGHLDLDLLAGDQIAARHAKARGGDLLDPRVCGIAVGKRGLAIGVLAALARVGLGADAVHRDGEGAVRLVGDGAKAHGAGREAPHDGVGGLDLAQGHGAGGHRHKLEEVAQHDGAALGVQRPGVLREELGAVLAHGTAQKVDDLRRDDVLLAAERAPLGDAGAGQLRGRGGLEQGQRLVVALVALSLDAILVEAAHARDGAREAAVDKALVESDDLEDLRGVVALHRGDAHLGHDRGDARVDSAVVVGDALLGAHAQRAVLRQGADALVGHVGVDARGGVAHERGVVVRGDGVAALDHDVGPHADAGADQVVVDGRDREQGRDGHLALARAVGDGHHVGPGAHGLLDVLAQRFERRPERACLRLARIRGREARGAEPLTVERGDALELVPGEDGVVQAEQLAVLAGVLEHVAVVTQVEHGGRHEALAQCVDGRIGDLREKLVEVVEERARAAGEHGEGDVRAHRGQRGPARVGHGAHGLLDVIKVVTVAGEALGEGDLGIDVAEGVALALGEVGHREGLLVDPVTEGLLRGKARLDLIVPDDAGLRGVDDEHLAGAERAGL